MDQRVLDSGYESAWPRRWFLQAAAIMCGWRMRESLNRKLVEAGLGISRTKEDSHWNPTYQAFHRIHDCWIRFCGTNQLVSINCNVILTLQTCGQRSEMTAGSKRRALAFYIPKQIWCIFLMPKSKRRERCRSAHFSSTCKKNAAVYWRLSIKKYVWPQNSSEVATKQPHSIRKYRESVQI